MVDATKTMHVNHTSSNDGDYPARLLAKNTVYNLMGRILPMAIALAAIPYIIEGLGVERFGVLTLAWMVVGYFGIFDMGIGRATTKFVAQAISRREQEQLPSLVWTSLLLLVAFGMVAGILAALLTPWLVSDVLNIPEALKGESRMAFLLLAASMPFVLGTSGARGVLEGQQRFRLVNAIKIPASAATFLMPLVVLFFSNNLFHIVAVLVGGRCVVFFIHAYVCIASLPGRKVPQFPHGVVAKRLLGFGGWLTATNVFGALMALGYIDRLIISSKLDMSAVAYYGTPFELTTKLLLVSGGLLGVLFPVFSAYAIDQKHKLEILHQRAVKVLFLSMGMVTIGLVAFASPFLNLWLDESFARESAVVLQLLAVGVLMSAISSPFFGAIQALGRPDLTAKRHLVELPFYAVAMWFCTVRWGIVGAAAVWTAWQVVDIGILLWFLKKLLPSAAARIQYQANIIVVGVVAVTAGAFALSAISDLVTRAVLTLLALAAVLILSWRYILNAEDRRKLLHLLTPLAKPSEQLSTEVKQ